MSIHAKRAYTSRGRVEALDDRDSARAPSHREACRVVRGVGCGSVVAGTLLALLTIAPLGLSTGCLGPRRDDYRCSRSISVGDRSVEADRLWEAAQESLRLHRYRLDRVDRRAGLITTYPEPSQHFFEFWRHDVDTTPDLWESTLNPLRRRAEVTLRGADDGRWQDLVVTVHKQRLSSPDRQFNSSGAVYQYFGETLPSTTGLVQVTAELDVWLDVGRDPAMEDRLLHDILDRAGMSGDSVEEPADR